MAKKPVALDGLLNNENRPTDTGIPQRGAGQPMQEKKPKRKEEKRLTLAHDAPSFSRVGASGRPGEVHSENMKGRDMSKVSGQNPESTPETGSFFFCIQESLSAALSGITKNRFTAFSDKPMYHNLTHVSHHDTRPE